MTAHMHMSAGAQYSRADNFFAVSGDVEAVVPGGIVQGARAESVDKEEGLLVCRDVALVLTHEQQTTHTDVADCKNIACVTRNRGCQVWCVWDQPPLSIAGCLGQENGE